MRRFPLLQVDAFSDLPLAGNPCAVVLDADPLDAAAMQAIAREMNLSETAFVLKSARADVRARYFTPAAEIPLAGHPTIATIHALVETGRLPPSGSVSLELQEGPIRVDVEAREGRGPRVVMSQRRPRFLARHDPEQVLPLFGLAADDLLSGEPIETVSTGTPQLFVPLRGLDPLRRVALDGRGLAAYQRSSDFVSAHLFCCEGATPEGATFARHFAPPPHDFEDPFTGSATGGMGAWLWRRGRIASNRFTAEQGHWMGRPGSASVEVVGPRDDIETVRVGGTAVTVLEGTLRL